MNMVDYTERFKNLVPHPRYDSGIQISGLKISEQELRDTGLILDSEVIFPESALSADISKQGRSAVPKLYYVDKLKVCRKCRRSFIFYALEQKYWYEELRFYIRADCEMCVECRKSDQVLRQTFNRFSHLSGVNDIDSKDLEVLVSDAVQLFEAGILTKKNKLGSLKNKALKVIPKSPFTQKLIEVLEK